MTDTPEANKTEVAKESCSIGMKKDGSCSTSKCGKGKLVYWIVGLAFIGIIALISMPSGLDKVLVEKQVQNYANFLQNNPKFKAYNPKLTYDAVDVQGSYTDRFAVIKNPSLSLENAGQNISVSTASVQLYPGSADLSKVAVKLPDPIKVGEQGVELMAITFNTPFTVLVERSGNVVKSTSDMSNGFKVTTKDSKPEENTQISYDTKPDIETVYDSASNVTETRALLKNIKISNEAMGTLSTIPVFSMNAKDTALEGGRRNSNTQLEISNVIPTMLEPMVGAMALKADVDFTGDLDAIEKAEPNDMDLKIKNLALEGKAFSVGIVGDVSTRKEDSLPTGKANLSIKGFDYVRSNFIKPAVSEDTLRTIDSIVEKATGTSGASAKDVSIDFSREKGGSTRIGKSSFEEIAGIAMPLMMQQMIAPSHGGNTRAMPMPEEDSTPVVPEPKPEAVTPPPAATAPDHRIPHPLPIPKVE